MTDTSSGNYGYMTGHDYAHEFGQLEFIISQFAGRMCTMKWVKIMSCTNSGALSAVGTVDVQPLVNQIDGIGNMMPHGTVHKLSYFRLQGGTSAIIHDPSEGDLGIAIVADRDLSAAIAAKGTANPGSNRRFSMSDGFYLGGSLNGVPKNYLQFQGDTVTLGAMTKSQLFVTPLVVSVTASQVILGNPNKPLFNVTTSGGDSMCVLASLEA